MACLLIDTETTGLPTKTGQEFPDPELFKLYDNSRVVQIAIIKCSKAGEKEKVQTKYVKCDFKIPNSSFHGITDEICDQKGYEFDEIADWFFELLTGVEIIIAYNVQFDINLMLSEFYRINRKDVVDQIKNKKHTCAMLWGQRVMHFHKYPKLSEFYKHVLRKDIINAHDAGADVDAMYEALMRSGFFE